jgi:hypothetical protein
MDELHYKVSKDEQVWLDFVLTERPEPPAHICGRCRTPFGRSSLPCPNEIPNHTNGSGDVH